MTAAKPSQASKLMTDADRLRECRAAYREAQTRIEALEAALARATHHGRCYRIWDEETRMWCHIPMCCGAAVAGPDQCTCDYPGSPHDALTRERDDLRRQVEELRHAKSDVWGRLTRAQEHIRRMQREALDAKRRSDPASVVTIRPTVSDE